MRHLPVLLLALTLLGCAERSGTQTNNAVEALNRTPSEPPIPTPNEAVQAYRKLNPGDQKTDDQITFLLGTEHPGDFDGYAGFTEDFARLNATGEVQYRLGMSYAEGRDRESDPKKALELFQEAAEKRNAKAHIAIGTLYEEGMGVARDFDEARKHYIRAGELGDARGYMYVGAQLEAGNGVPQDYKTAMEMYRKAADLGVAEAYSHIGFMYLEGNGVPKSNEEGIKWYVEAADRGNEAAQTMLGVFYTTGNRMPPDLIEAYKWCNIRAANGDASAKSSRATLERQMTREQIAEAQRRALEWKPKPAKWR